MLILTRLTLASCFVLVSLSVAFREGPGTKDRAVLLPSCPASPFLPLHSFSIPSPAVAALKPPFQHSVEPFNCHISTL